MSGKRIFPEALISLRHRLSSLPSRSKERRSIMQETANLYGVSESTLYRALNVHNRPKPLRRSDCGKPRILPADEMEMYCEIIAAMKIRTSNKKSRHLSTSECIRSTCRTLVLTRRMAFSKPILDNLRKPPSTII